MFKSLQMRIVAMFVLLVLSAMLVAGTLLITRVGDFYSMRFIGDMESVFGDAQVSNELSAAAYSENEIMRITQIIEAYSGSGRLGISQSRNYYILDGKTGQYVDGSDIQTGDLVDKTENIITAMTGVTGKSYRFQGSYMDYAYPIMSGDSCRYVIYVRDDKTEVSNVIENIFWIILQVLGWGVLISLVLGFFLSRNITGPVVALTKKAERLAQGEYILDVPSKKRSDDEIGILSDTFSMMSAELFNNLVQMESEKTKLETILVNLTDGVIAFDTEGRIIHINPTAKQLLAIPNPDTVEFDTLFEDIGAKIKLGDIMYLKGAQTYLRTICFNNFVLEANFAAFHTDIGRDRQKPGGVVVAIQDITEQQKLDNSRREFVANVSHELRTPLTTIKSYTETLLDSVEDKETMESKFLGTINSEVDRMTRMVKDLLTLSRLDNGQRELKREPTDIAAMTQNIVERLKFDAATHKHSLTFSKTTDIPTVNIDRDRIEQVVINIITNAIKYTPDNGRIQVFAGYAANEVYIKVKDNGIGIPKGDLDRIFERFYRVDKARTRKAGGSGLGLAIAKEIMDAHGGSIRITSEVDEGSEVMITLPMKDNG